jgi:hypothetical protein
MVVDTMYSCVVVPVSEEIAWDEDLPRFGLRFLREESRMKLKLGEGKCP